MPTHEWLRQSDVRDKIPHACVAFGKPAHDPQPVHVGQGLVNDFELTQVVGLIDDRGQRRADPSRGWTQGESLLAIASTAIYINAR
jgi:hypothetical protein